jgi:hypothetical protein
MMLVMAGCMWHVTDSERHGATWDGAAKQIDHCLVLLAKLYSTLLPHPSEATLLL